MNKTHFGTATMSVCGRGKRGVENVYRVTCSLCLNHPLYERAKSTADIAKREAFEAQTPREFREPWHTEDKPMVCKVCDGKLFREGDRTCYGHYANFHCANCGHIESRLTETGMSF